MDEIQGIADDEIGTEDLPTDALLVDIYWGEPTIIL